MVLHKQQKKADFISILAFVIVAALGATLVYQTRASAHVNVSPTVVHSTPQAVLTRHKAILERQQRNIQITHSKARRLFFISAGPLWHSISTLSVSR